MPSRARVGARGALPPSLVLLLLVIAPTPARAQQPVHPDVIRGRVLADSGGTAISGADVVATMAPDRLTEVARTDSLGRFELRFAQGTGDYLLHVNLIGWQPWRQRITRTGADSVLTVDVRLAARAIALTPVDVQARRPPPQRAPDILPGTGAAEQTVTGVPAAVSPTEQGDLAAMAATLPGVNAVAGGISVLGLAPSQNNALLNGMSFGGSDVPREARTWTRVTSSTFDPQRGGFSGAQVSVDLVPGNIFSSRRAHLTLDAPPFQYTDPVAARLGQRFTNLQGSLGGDGELVRDRFNYNVAAQVSRRSEDATSLLTAGDEVLRPAGVAPDSVTRFLQLLSAAGVPSLAGSPADTRVTSTASLIGRLDHTPRGRRSWALTGYARYSGTATPLSPLATPAHGGTSRSGLGMVQAQQGLYFGKDFLNLARSAFTLSGARMRPRLELPDGRVLVGSDFTDGSGGLATLAFGGNGALDSDSRSWTWETSDELQLYNRNSRHKVKLFADSRLDRFSRADALNPFGAYSYNSLADFAANRPASYTRVLRAPRASGGEWSGVLAASDQWRHGGLSLLFGGRLEANRFTTSPAFNPAVLSVFGARTDAAPNTVHLSPRLGFSFNPSRQDRAMIQMSGLGTRIHGPEGVFRGGIGEFRSFLPPTLLADASVATALSDATRRLLCVGPAVPLPDWSALAAGGAPAERCADGSAGFAETAPGVRLFDPAYDAARSWRANLGWAGTLLGLGVSVDGIYALNLHQPDAVDLNFTGTPRFTLADEGRPVYVSPSAVVPATGALSPLEARRSDAFGRVLSARSELRGWSRQLSFTVTPSARFSGRYFGSLSYTLAQARMQRRGFEGGAFGDPAEILQAPTDYDIRHQVQLQAGYSLRWLDFSLFGVLSSGRPFTPLVGGDVNGDGVAGDRAFVFDPAQANATAAGMRSLLAGAPTNVRDCLQRQLGHAAAPNSCRGPWSATMRAQLALGNRFPGAGGRVHAALNLANPLEGLDQLLHGSGRLHGWGSAPTPDPVLYQVAGFDPSTNRFRYTVNPRFGDTRPSANTFRSPFRLTLDVQVDLGKSMDAQQLERSTAPGHRMGVAELKAMYTRNVLDVYQQILEQSDSLLLSQEQTRALKEAQQRYRGQLDSLWTDLAQYVAALPAHYDVEAARKRQEAAIDEGWKITWNERTTIRSILTPLQQRMIPDFVATLLNAREVPRIRVFINH